MVAVRAMTFGDIEVVLTLATQTPEAPQWDRTVYESIVSPYSEKPAPRVAWVAFDGPGLLGFAVAHQIAEVCELECIVTAKSVRRQGIGTLLLNSVVDCSRASGAQKLELEVRAGNDSAIAFYEKAGFLREGLRLQYYRDPEEDAVLMGKSLYSND